MVLALLVRSTMSYGNEEASTHRRDGRMVLAPETLDDEPPTRLRAHATPATPYVQRSAVQPHAPHEYEQPSYVAPAYTRERTEPSVHALQPAIAPVPRSRSPHPADVAAARRSSQKIVTEASRSGHSSSKTRERSGSVKPVAEPAPSAHSRSARGSAPMPAQPEPPVPAPEAKSASQSKSKSKSASQPQLARGSSKSVADAAPGPAIPGMIDPMQVIVPPELAPTIYSWVRRLALQADLQTADRVLRDALLEITSSLAVSIVYPGQDGLWTLGSDDEIPKDATPIIACAQARRALIASHTALIPIVTTSECVGVIILTRNPRNPGYLPVEQIAMIGLTRESASILHHLAVQHLQRADEAKLDKGSLYRGEALEAHRTKGNEGSLVQLSPSWVKRAYPLLIGAALIALVFSVFITVPTYSTGSGFIQITGAQVSAQQGGTVDVVLVAPGQAVLAGTAIVRLSAQAEMDELAAARTEHNGTLQQMLFDATDEQLKKQLHASHNRLTLAEARVNAKTVRATKDGTVSDIRVRAGQPLQPGEPIATIVQPGAEPEVYAFLPSKDRPSLRTGQPLQVDLIGYTKSRELATITSIGTEAFGGNEAAKVLGQTLADALKLPPGSYVLVKGRLPRRTFKHKHDTLNFHHGMLTKTEVKLSEKPFLVTLLPAIEKYIP